MSKIEYKSNTGDMTHKASGCHISVKLIHDDPEHVNMIATASHHECIATIPLCRTAKNITHDCTFMA